MRPLGRKRAARAVVGDAQVEGLAAGTGLLTGAVAARRAHESRVPPERCPSCGDAGDVAVVDLVAQRTTRRCIACGHRWEVGLAGPPPA